MHNPLSIHNVMSQTLKSISKMMASLTLRQMILLMNPNHCQHNVIVMDLNLKGCLRATMKIVKLNGFTLNV